MVKATILGGEKSTAVGMVILLLDRKAGGNGGITVRLTCPSLPVTPEEVIVPGASLALELISHLLQFAPPLLPIPTTSLEVQGVNVVIPYTTRFQELYKARNLQCLNNILS